MWNFKEEPEPGPSRFIPVNVEPRNDNLNDKPTILDLDTEKLKVWSSEEMQRIDNQVAVMPVLGFHEEM